MNTVKKHIRNVRKKSGHKTWAQTAALSFFLFFITSIFPGCITTKGANDEKGPDNQKTPSNAEETTGEMTEVTIYQDSKGIGTLKDDHQKTAALYNRDSKNIGTLKDDHQKTAALYNRDSKNIGTLKDDHQKTAALYNRDSRKIGSADIDRVEVSGNAQTVDDIAKETERGEKNVVLRTIDTISDGVIIGVNTVIIKPLGVAKEYVIDKPIDFLQKNVIYREEVKDSGKKPQDPAGEF